MLENDKKAEKVHLRKEILAKRSALSREERAMASRQIVQEFLNSTYYKDAQVIFAFAPFRDEVEIDTVIEACWADKKRVFLPRVDANSRVMQFYEIQGWLDLEQGHYGIREPKLYCMRYVSSDIDIDLILMPGAAFDLTKSRLGYGAGYYDRFLSQLEPKPYLIAPAYAVQIVPHVPTDPWDYPIDMIVTENGWL